MVLKKSKVENRKSTIGWAPCALIVLIAALFGEHLLRGLSSAAVLFESLSQWNPFWTFARGELARGHFPLWTLHSLAGWYFIGFAHTACFYPLGFLFYLLPYDFAATYNTLGHLILTSLFMYRFLKGMRCSPSAAFACSLLWSTSGFLLAFVNFIPLLWTVTWTPLFFDAANRWINEGRLRHILIISAVTAVQLLGGSVESLAYELISLGLFVALLHPGWLREQPGRAMGLGLALGLSILLCAVQFLPSMGLTSQSVRSIGISYDYFAQRGFPIWGWLTMASPFDIPLILKVDQREGLLVPAYFGLMTLGFAIYALFSSTKTSHHPVRRVGLLILLLVLFTARDVPVIGWVSYRLPVLNLLREANFGLFLPEFFIVLLAAWGLDRFLKHIAVLSSADKSTAGAQRAVPFAEEKRAQHAVPLRRGRMWTLLVFAVTGVVSAALVAFTTELEFGDRLLRVVWPEERRVLACWIMLLVAGVAFTALVRPRYFKAAIYLGLAGVLILDTWALAWAYLPRNDHGFLSINSEYKDFFSRRPLLERNIIIDSYGALNKNLPPHLGMLAGTQTLDGWEGLPNLRLVLFLDLLDDRALELKDGRMERVGYHQVFREGGFVETGRLPYLNLAGVRYLVSRKFPVKFSSPYSLVDAFPFFRVPNEGDLTANWKKIDGRIVKLLELLPRPGRGSSAKITYNVTEGDTLIFGLRSDGRKRGSFEIMVREMPRGIKSVLYSMPLEKLPDQPGEPVRVNLSEWYGKTVELEFRATGEGDGTIVLVEPAMVNPMKPFQRAHHGVIDIFSNREAFPRAFMVHRAVRVGNAWEALAWLQNHASSLRHVAPIEGDLSALPVDYPGRWDSSPLSAGSERVEFTRYEPDRVWMEIEAKAPGYLILTDSYFPGWEALLDGKPALLLPAYLNFRAIPIYESGFHRVQMVFKPQSFRLGLWTTLSSSLMLFTLACWSAFRRQRRSG